MRRLTASPRRLNPRNRSRTAAKPEESSSTEQGLGKKMGKGAGNSAHLCVFVCFSELKRLKKGTGDRRDGNEHATNVFSSFHKPIFPPKRKKLMGRWHKWCQHPVSQMTAAPPRRRNMRGGEICTASCVLLPVFPD